MAISVASSSERPRYNDLVDIGRLPGGELISRGLADLANGEETIESLLVAIGAPRLRRLGFLVPSVDRPEHRLYDLLAATGSDTAHSRYNALLRKLTSFERAAECVV